jgi:hypothetical protein
MMGEQAREIVALLALLASVGSVALGGAWLLARRGVHVDDERFLRDGDASAD